MCAVLEDVWMVKKKKKKDKNELSALLFKLSEVGLFKDRYFRLQDHSAIRLTLSFSAAASVFLHLNV